MLRPALAHVKKAYWVGKLQQIEEAPVRHSPDASIGPQFLTVNHSTKTMTILHRNLNGTALMHYTGLSLLRLSETHCRPCALYLRSSELTELTGTHICWWFNQLSWWSKFEFNWCEWPPSEGFWRSPDRCKNYEKKLGSSWVLVLLDIVPVEM